MSAGTAVSPEIAVATLEGPKGQMPFQLFKTETSFKIAHDIFAGITYPQVPFVGDIRTILDIGANVGAASAYLAMNYPHARVYALEPGAKPFALLKQNVLAFENVSAFPFGLYASDKQVPLFRGRMDCVESSVCPNVRTNGGAEEIQLRCAPQFLAEQGIERIDILKIDTEGCEVPILRSLEKHLPAVKVLYLEYHSERDRRLLDQLLAESHVLWKGHVDLVHRGEFCYLRRDLLPGENETHTCEILLPLE
jgi:FkbM family methyltransferase